jgi:enamine deaminase RidA (YjgF/YER057c/UK114 family)
MPLIHKQETIRKISSDGVGYSVVDLSDVRHIFAAAVPRKGETLQEQAQDALETIEAVMCDEGSWGSIVKQAVFYSDYEQLDELRRIMGEFYGPDLPATTYVPQHPCDGKLLAIEALGVGQGYGEVEIERRNEHVVIARHNGISWIHCGQIVPRSVARSVYGRSLNCFRQMRDLLTAEGVDFDQIIRTWLYLGDIVGEEGETQRYKELNRARSDYFRNHQFGGGLVPTPQPGTVYPASTGIGTDNHDVVMSCIAFSTDRDDIVAVPLENPRQTAAFDYAEHYSPKSPQFSRAMALSCGRFSTIFVSGTASITDSETQHVGDVAAQTTETLDNIEALIGEENLARHGLPGLGTSLEGLAFARVYIKFPKDHAQVRAICEARLGELPIIYAVADVCRDDLLVEIEGIACANLGER